VEADKREECRGKYNYGTEAVGNSKGRHWLLKLRQISGGTLKPDFGEIIFRVKMEDLRTGATGSANWNMLIEQSLWAGPSVYFGEHEDALPPSRLGPGSSSSAREEKAAGKLSIIILLVEDNPADAFLVEEALIEQNLICTLHHVKDGQQAISFIERAEVDESAPCPNLLLLDLNLPKRSGQQVLERVRQSTKCGDIPVIIVTSSEAATDREAMARLGVDRYFRKPTNLEEFMSIGRVVKEVWDKRYNP